MRSTYRIVVICLVLGILIPGCLGRQAKKHPMTEAERLYRANCRACHVLPKPNEYRYEQWLEILSSHSDRVDLSPEVRAAILKHLRDSN